MFHVPEKFRVLPEEPYYENNGVFRVPVEGVILQVIASDGMGWEHVSVSLRKRTPLWEEMCAVKNLFWDTDDLVIQFHPDQDTYKNLHPHCLHLWRKYDSNDYCERPPLVLV